ncbi:dihydrodipicolinate synthase family protein [Thermoplasma sp.]|uniref:dihydrodipicolinate synthase family protein n=1 Tax=Thermoplasma sp. TaxID=1973142 RepID=UPI00261A9603|nr:dihydrodipicolinate synthase family protein [Thermoplasma sp.]
MSDLIVPMITPFTDNNTIDTERLLTHAEYLIKNGVDYLLVSGSTGLGPSLRMEEKAKILNDLHHLKDKIIFQVGSLDLEESRELARLGKRNEVKYIASLPPYYYPRIPEEWYIRFFKEISEIYPTLVYNFPLTTNYDIKPDLVTKINKSGGNIVGIKDTVPDLDHLLNFKWEFGNDFKVYCGPDVLVLASLRMGMDGAIPGSGNYAPKIARSLFENYQNDRGVIDQRILTRLAMIARKYGQWAANYSLVKIIGKYDPGKPRPPIYPLDQKAEEALSREVMEVLKSGRT